ncbi:kinesin-domain-containing protein [Athelia psychrophila]|uniref:Kinesin-domain-containing protein n=1 Tax=Athelia psychrophila TaxID=1759441 RepID=A0A166CHR6_9AGAM|nr:kinesin-domain-containing protein [Fibularhizoctonia sp. CBS 109695]
MAPTSTPIKPRQTPFTPKRPLSSVSGSISSTSSIASASSAATVDSTTGNVGGTSGNPIKKFRAALSSESRSHRLLSTPKPRPISTSLAPPASPSRSTGSFDASRPRTPGTPGRRSPMPGLGSRIDPEEVLVDAATVEPGDGDVSVDNIDEALLRGSGSSNAGDQDKVLVSICPRIRPTDSTCAWTSPNHQTIHLAPGSATPGKASAAYNFDNILIGTPNKPIYAATASGKTFTLSGDPDDPGIIPRAMRDVFAYIRATLDREYLLRCSYLEIYNEAIHDLLSAG